MDNKRYFIDIINKFIYGGEYKPPIDIDWHEIKRLAEIHSLGGLVGVVVNRSNIKMPIECYEYFDYMVFDCARNGIMWEKRYNEVTSALSSVNIPHIIVKGYILRNIYPEKDMRTMGDLDFVVHKEDMERARDALLASGYTLESVFKGEWCYKKDNMLVELHPGLMDADVGFIDYEGYMSKIFDNTKVIKGCTYELTDEFHFIYMTMHIMKHFYSDGAGIRMMLDMALFIKRYKQNLDWNYINRELKNLKMDVFFDNIQALCYRLFDSGINNKIDEELYNEVFDYIMTGGAFGFARKNFEISQSRDRIAKNEYVIKTLFKRAFPSDNEMRGLVLWYYNKPKALLPVAWAYRWVNSAFLKRGKLVKSIILTAENKESRKQLEMLKKLGLYRR